MHMTFQTYRTIKRSLMQTLLARSGSHHEQHINTLALLICGIVGAQHVQFAQIADHAPLRGRKTESLFTRFRRFVKHKDVTPEAVWLPFAKAVLSSLAPSSVTIILDGTSAGRGCMVLMVSVVYHGRALPLLWTVVKRNKGHLPQAAHCALMTRLQAVIPDSAQVLLLGDGEFDGTQLHAALRTARWEYVCRTGINITIICAGAGLHGRRSAAQTRRGGRFGQRPDDRRTLGPGSAARHLGDEAGHANLSGNVLVRCAWSCGVVSTAVSD